MQLIPDFKQADSIYFIKGYRWKHRIRFDLCDQNSTPKSTQLVACPLIRNHSFLNQEIE